MAVDAILGLLGISRKAGKLAFGEEQVRDMVASRQVPRDLFGVRRRGRHPPQGGAP